MTLEDMKALPTNTPETLQYTTYSDIIDNIRKHGIKTSKRKGYIRLALGDIDAEKYARISNTKGIDYIITINGTTAVQKYDIEFHYLSPTYVFTTGTSVIFRYIEYRNL